MQLPHHRRYLAVAWIEISSSKIRILEVGRYLAVAWIEIEEFNKFIQGVDRRYLAVAWIEIHIANGNSISKGVSLPRGSVDRNLASSGGCTILLIVAISWQRRLKCHRRITPNYNM